MFSRLKKYLVILFGISSVEANGIVIIYIILAIITTGTLMWSGFPGSVPGSFRTDSLLLDSIFRILADDQEVVSPPDFSGKTVKRPVLFRFDPNTAAENELEDLGMPAWLAHRIVKYREAGGRFIIKNDLLKIYGMSATFYERLEKYIMLPDSISVPDKASLTGLIEIKNTETQRIELDLNLSDSADFVKIRGIGPKLASRIIKYRLLLGGFVSVDQLNEIYGLSDPALTNLKKSAMIGQSFIPVKININFAGWRDLVGHPYIDRNTANAIIRKRDENGPYRSLEDVKQIKSIHDSIFSRLSPYITF